MRVWVEAKIGWIYSISTCKDKWNSRGEEKKGECDDDGTNNDDLEIESVDYKEYESSLVSLPSEQQMQFPKTIDILNSPFIWIGDTGATGHSSFTSQGGTNFRESKIIIHGVVGGDIKPNTEMDLECTYCNEFGNKLYDMTLTDTSHLLDSNFNLLSLTRTIRGGWEIYGNVDAITMTKGNQTM